MAGNVQIAIKDEQTAKQWLALVQDINTDYLKAMTDAGETMINMKDFAEGTLVDDFVKYGTDLCNAAQKTFDAIGTINGDLSFGSQGHQPGRRAIRLCCFCLLKLHPNSQ